MIYALIAGALVALISVSGALVFNARTVHGTHRSILPFAIGVFLGVVFLDLIPETLAAAPEYGMYAVLAGFFAFYLLTYFISTYHHHDHAHDAADDRCRDRARMLLFGDTIHNAADGVVIASAFLVDPFVGVGTTIAIMLHEFPQEIAEFGILLDAGYTRGKALALNLLSATSIFIGVFATMFIMEFASNFLWIVTGLAAGNLLYIATSDLLPELRRSHQDHFFQTFFATAFGLALFIAALSLAHAIPV